LAIARSPSAGPKRTWTAASPGGTVTATVGSRAGAYELAVTRGGRRLLTASLGLTGAPDGPAAQDTVHDTYVTPAGKRRRHELAARRLTLQVNRGRRLEVLVADDGVAFRQTGAGSQDAAWSAPTGARAWLQSYRPDYEGPYRPFELRSAQPGEYGFPALLDTGAGAWALLTESGVTREAAARLTVSGGRPGVLGVVLPKGEASPETTPWRVAVVGDLATVVGSDLPLSLGGPSAISDTSWIRPGRAAWSWWSDANSPGDASRQRVMVRAASAYRWEYVLLDEGWNPQDVPGIVRYGAGKGVRVMLWTAWDALRDPAQRQRLFARWASWGVAGVKVDFLLSDSAARMAVYEDIARDAARYRLAVVFHGCTVPRGIQRRWPNVLSMEAVEGTEREIPSQGAETMDPRQDVNLVFTRNVVGSMDYTPVTFSAQHRDSTEAHRLALAVAFESGVQHFADTPESYAAHVEAARTLADVPAAWDDTRLLAGGPDHEAVVARRSGDRWWVASITATGAHVQTADLGFLQAGRNYRLHLVRDDGHGGLAAEDRTVTSHDRLSVAVERNGGYVAELVPIA